MSISSIVSTIFLLAGSFFFIVGSMGLNRLPDDTRLHATTKCDTLGQALTLLGVIFYDGATFTSVKILLITVFILIANPTAAHALAKGAYLHGVKPCDVTSLDMYKEEAKRIKRRLK